MGRDATSAFGCAVCPALDSRDKSGGNDNAATRKWRDARTHTLFAPSGELGVGSGERVRKLRSHGVRRIVSVSQGMPRRGNRPIHKGNRLVTPTDQ